MSDGVIHDFAGPYTITIDDLAFGETHKYVPLDVKEPQRYDTSVMKADKIYSEMMHNICCNNCHSHVARAMNKYQYRGRTDYTMIDVWWLTITQSRYVSWGHLVKSYIGFVIIMSLIALLVFM
jgi:transmembrane protein 222